MRWQIGGQGWPIAGGARLIPAGTIVGDGGIPLKELPMPLPIDAEAMDADAALQMLEWYGSELWHQIKFVAAVNRDAVIARRRGRK